MGGGKEGARTVSYRVVLEPSALQDLRKVAPDVQARLSRDLQRLARDPRPHDSEALHGKLRGLRKLRQGQWRIAYRVDDGARTVHVVEVGHRATIYKRLAKKGG